MSIFLNIIAILSVGVTGWAAIELLKSYYSDYGEIRKAKALFPNEWEQRIFVREGKYLSLQYDCGGDWKVFEYMSIQLGLEDPPTVATWYR